MHRRIDGRSDAGSVSARIRRRGSARQRACGSPRAPTAIDRRAWRKGRQLPRRLPDLYRSAFVLRDLEELTTAEVADVLGVEPATVRQRVHRARLMLRGYLGALAGVRS
jgi:DNA-directed RNA polymerase specialized sigma24 family protein